MASAQPEGKMSEGRQEDRLTSILRASLRDGGREREASVLDLSSRGLMAHAKPAPERGTYVELLVGRHSLVGHVQWSGGNRFGVKLRERIDVLAVIGNEAGPVVLAAAQRARGKPSVEARLAFSRHVARGFTFGIMIAAGVSGASLAAELVTRSLAPLERVSAVLAAPR